ncbi:MAG: METTL5 family protein [Candidatus Bathyarchaeota archaeon]|jgi:putative methylase|nr:methyltransferase [Candidatus Bathyarchaeota archaeon A05DMB-5]MDH7557295.1 METTL5 family protein [Candidatus Bathyarchaeota archaeon]
MQKRIIRKLDLEMMLSQVKPHPSPKPNLEQYTIPADVAATMLYMAAYTYNDIIGKSVLDLGCGTGRLALGAAFLGAKQVVGVDLDKAAIKVACENARQADLREKVEWIIADINAVNGNFDTILQNPPYGVQRPQADRKFLEKALKTAKAIYSLHKSTQKDKAFIKRLKHNKAALKPATPNPFLEKLIEEHGGRIKVVYVMLMTIPHMFNFHTKRKHEFLVDLYVIEGKDGLSKK